MAIIWQRPEFSDRQRVVQHQLIGGGVMVNGLGYAGTTIDIEGHYGPEDWAEARAYLQTNQVRTLQAPIGRGLRVRLQIRVQDGTRAAMGNGYYRLRLRAYVIEEGDPS